MTLARMSTASSFRLSAVEAGKADGVLTVCRVMTKPEGAKATAQLMVAWRHTVAASAALDTCYPDVDEDTRDAALFSQKNGVYPLAVTPSNVESYF